MRNAAETTIKANAKLHIALLAPFGLRPKATASARALPLGQALSARGHRVRLIVPPWDDETAPDDGRKSIVGGVEVVELARPKIGAPGAGLVGWTAGLLREGLRGKPDVAHIFKPKGYAGLAGYALAALGRAWVLDTDDWEGRGGWNAQNPYSWPQRLFFDTQERTLPGLAGAVTVASRTLQTQVWGFGAPRRRVFYAPNGVTAARYGPWIAAAADQQRKNEVAEKYNVPADKQIVALYTRFFEYPLEWVINALQLLAPEFPDVRLLVIGSGFFGEEQRLEELAARAGLRERLIICGRVPEGDLGPLLALAAVALYPIADTLLNRAKSPVKLIEPMALGLPVVANRVGEVGEVIRHQESGWLVDPGDVTGLANGLATLLRDPALRQRIGKAAADRIWRDYNWQTLAQSVEQAYYLALARRGQKQSR